MTSAPRPIATQDLDKVSGGAVVEHHGTEGRDTFNTGISDDRIHAGGGNDYIIAGYGDDEIHAGAGDDVAAGMDGNDTIHGGAGNDQVIGGYGADVLYGDDGDDRLVGGHTDRADDLAFGGAGNDSFEWNHVSGNDTFHGGSGTDTLILQSYTADQLRGMLTLTDPSLRMVVGANGMVSFQDATGAERSFSGQLTAFGSTVTFTDIERLQVRV